MRGCLECATLYERDLVGQADHAPESPRPREACVMRGCLPWFVQTRSGRSGGSRAGIATTAAACAMRGCLPWVCTNAIWSVRRVTCRNHYDRGGVRDVRVFAVGGTNAIWPVRRVTCRNRHDHARSHVLGPALTLGVTAWRTQAARGHRAAGDQSRAVSCAAIGCGRGMKSGADRACSTASANARTSYGSGPPPSRLAIGDAMTGIPVARSSAG